MVSSPSLDYEPEENDDQEYTPAETQTLLPGLDTFAPLATERDPLKKARDLLDELLEMSCEVPLSEVHDMAEESGVTASEVLGWAEKSDSCFVDWMSGHIRCNEDTDG